MRRRVIGTVLGGALIALVPFLSGPANAVPTTVSAPVSSSFHHACADAAPGHAHCDALVQDGLGTSAKTLETRNLGPSGLTPADLQAAYKLPSSTAGAGQTIAVVDAYDDPNAEADLNAYRKQFGLGPCTTASGCFKKVVQPGTTADVGWAEEISLDLDMVSAICPRCKVVLVEANSASFAALGTAENTAASGQSTHGVSRGSCPHRTVLQGTFATVWLLPITDTDTNTEKLTHAAPPTYKAYSGRLRSTFPGGHHHENHERPLPMRGCAGQRDGKTLDLSRA